jgi:putative spermidine/putrescine transport system substrate-binding protein
MSFGCLAFPVLAQAPTAASRLVVGVVGGTLGQEFRTRILEFTKPANVETVFVEGTTTDLLARVRAQKDNPQIDLFIANDRTFATAKSLGLLEKLDPKLIPNLSKVRSEYKDPDGYGQAFELQVLGWCYRTDKFAEAGIPRPTSWSVYEDPRLKGRAILFNPTVSFGYFMLIGIAKGSGQDERDISVAWAKLDRIVANKAIVASTPGQAETLAGGGEGWIYVCPASRGKLARDQGAPIGFSVPEEAAISYLDYYAPVRNAKNGVVAQRVINHLISVEVQTKRAYETAMAPINLEVVMTPEIKERMGFEKDKPAPSYYVPNVEVIIKQLDDWVDRFNRATSTR